MIDAQPLAGERLLITGASSGLGAHFARLAVAAGAEVVAAARRADALDALVAELRDVGGTAEALALDVTDSASVDQLFSALKGRLPTVLVNNAGMEPGVFSFLNLDEAGWDATINTNLKGTWLWPEPRPAPGGKRGGGQHRQHCQHPCLSPAEGRHALRRQQGRSGAANEANCSRRGALFPCAVTRWRRVTSVAP